MFLPEHEALRCNINCNQCRLDLGKCCPVPGARWKTTKSRTSARRTGYEWRCRWMARAQLGSERLLDNRWMISFAAIYCFARSIGGQFVLHFFNVGTICNEWPFSPISSFIHLSIRLYRVPHWASLSVGENIKIFSRTFPAWTIFSSSSVGGAESWFGGLISGTN